MPGIKSLAKDTAIYGVSSIVGRFLNWCLVPLYTIKFPAAEYGIVNYIYSFTALTLIVLIYGMETGFFRFTSHERYEQDPMRVYSTSLISLAVTSSLFFLAVMLFIKPVTTLMECTGHEDYVAMMAAVVAIDAFTSIPFSYLRYRKRALRFASLKLISIGLNIGLNLWWILISPWLLGTEPSLRYIFLSNLISSGATLLLLRPELHGFRWRFDSELWRRMLSYSWPLLVLGVAGIMNQTLGNILLPHLVPDKATAMAQLGIYGANQKIAIVMVIFLQAFRFAYEPFIFAQSRERGEDKRRAYSDAMKYFVIFAMLIFLVVMFYLDILKYFISPNYFSGLKVVPVIMVAEFFFGVFFNLSVWYKITDRTVWGMWFSLIGLIVTVVLNILLVPRIGYMGCALAALACYGVMMLASYFTGQARYPISYPVGRLTAYFCATLTVWALTVFISTGHQWLDMGVRTIILVICVMAVCRIENINPAALLRHRKPSIKPNR
ncbi:MAG: oligosaccharide flippase family protein [Bacteroides sp.]|nr:oligosaccharide flippase family protein [Bacteroides sp.]